MTRIGFGGGCHWCTEAVFQSLQGITGVQQGYVASDPPDDMLSEAVIVEFDSDIIPLSTLVEIHLRTHSSTSNHVLRGKYRSAVYVFDRDQCTSVESILGKLQSEFHEPLVTRALFFRQFSPSDERFQNYYATDSTRPFCKAYIDPKLAMLRKGVFGGRVKIETFGQNRLPEFPRYD